MGTPINANQTRGRPMVPLCFTSRHGLAKASALFVAAGAGAGAGFTSPESAGRYPPAAGVCAFCANANEGTMENTKRASRAGNFIRDLPVARTRGRADSMSLRTAKQWQFRAVSTGPRMAEAAHRTKGCAFLI